MLLTVEPVGGRTSEAFLSGNADLAGVAAIFWLVSWSIIVAAIVIVVAVILRFLGRSSLGSLFLGLLEGRSFFCFLRVIVAAIAVAITFRRVGVLGRRIGLLIVLGGLGC